MATNDYFEKKGAGVGLQPLLDQTSYAVELAMREEEALASRGFGSEKIAEMMDLDAQLRPRASQSHDARTESKGHTVSERQAQVSAKAFARTLRSALVDLEVQGVMSEVERDGFNVKGPLASSTPKIVGWLVQIFEPLRKFAPALSPLMGDADPVSTHARLLSSLSNAQGVQELGVAALPLETREVRVLKGRLLALIEAMNRAGRRAYEGDAIKASFFNKDLILRAVKKEAVELKVVEVA